MLKGLYVLITGCQNSFSVGPVRFSMNNPPETLCDLRIAQPQS